MTRGRVVVVGLGPAGPDLLTAGTIEAIAAIPVRFVRTTRHPAAIAVGAATSCDDLYSEASSVAEVYPAIVDRLVEAAGAHGTVLYAVPGSPRVAERSVELLVADGRVDVEVHAALSFLDLAWVRLGVDPMAVGVRLVDGHRFAADAAGERGPLLVVQCDRASVLSEIKLAVDEPPATVIVLQRLGLDDEQIRTVAWAELDRGVEPDHLTSLYVERLAAPVGRELIAFAELVRTLREACPWDREQTHETLTRHLVEEAHEVLDAIAALGDPDELGIPAGYDHLCEELGDLLFQVVFHATIAAETGGFTLADVASGIHDKLVRRHPHVFAGVDAADADAVVTNWEQIKRDEKGRTSLMDGIGAALPALLAAHKVQRKAASVGFDWDEAAPVYATVVAELCELIVDPTPDEMGDVLFSAVNLARKLKIDPEAALRAATTRFRQRFEHVETAAAASGIDLVAATAAQLDELWEAAKARES